MCVSLCGRVFVCVCVCVRLNVSIHHFYFLLYYVEMIYFYQQHQLKRIEH